MSNPGLTVIMANYNDAEFIPNAVLGVLNQKYPVEQVIIVDDGSTDNSKEIIQRLAKEYSQIIMLEHETNKGVVHAFNYALQHTETEYVCFVSMDDAINPEWLYTSMCMLQKYPKAGLCCSNLYHVFPESGGKICENLAPWGEESAFISNRDLADIAKGHYISGTSVVVKTKYLIECGGYRPDLLWHSDWFAWWVIAFRYGICFIPQCLVSLRVRSTSHSFRGIANWKQQKVVLTNIFNTINSYEFSDVLPYFIRGNVMSHFGVNAVRAIIGNRGLWSFTNFMLIKRMLISPKLWLRFVKEAV